MNQVTMIIGHDADLGTLTERFTDKTPEQAYADFMARWPDATNLFVLTAPSKSEPLALATAPYPTAHTDAPKAVDNSVASVDLERKTYDINALYSVSKTIYTWEHGDGSLVDFLQGLHEIHGNEFTLLSVAVQWEWNEEPEMVHPALLKLPEMYTRYGSWKITYINIDGDENTFEDEYENSYVTIGQFSESENILSVEVKWEGTDVWVSYTFSEEELKHRC